MPNPFDIGYYQSDDLKKMGFAHVGGNVVIARNCLIHGLEHISIGDNVRIDGFCTMTATGESIKIGSFVHIGAYCELLGAGGIVFEDFSCISHGVRIFTTSDDFSGKHLIGPLVPSRLRKPDFGRVTLQRHALIGTGSVILPNVTIGEGSAVGALSLVKENIPAWSLYAGCPARKIGDRSRDLLDLENGVRGQ